MIKNQTDGTLMFTNRSLYYIIVYQKGSQKSGLSQGFDS